MTERHGPEGGRHEDEQLVEEFFAAHRAAVQEQPADEVTWARIRDRRRSGRRGARWGTVLGLGAAAAALAVAAYVSLPSILETPPAGPTTTLTPTDPAPTEPGPTATEPTRVVPTEVPDDLAVTAVSSVGDTVYALGLQEGCPDGEDCVLLVRSTDRGESWTVVAVVSGSAFGVVFADADTGWVWGDGDLRVTRDGGRTFTEMAHAGDVVTDVVTDGVRLAVATARDCLNQQGCVDHRLAVSTIEAENLSDDTVALTDDPADRHAVTVSMGADAVFAGLEPVETAGLAFETELTRLVRVQDGSLDVLADPMDCVASPSALLAAAERVFVACLQVGQDGEPGSDVAVIASDLGGRVWGSAGQGFPAPYGGLFLAVTNADHLVAITPDEMLASTDGGQTFTEPPVPLPYTASSVRSLTGAADGTVVAVILTAPEDPPSYWTSTDHGQTWERIDLLGD